MNPRYIAHAYHHPLEIAAAQHVEGPRDPEWHDDYSYTTFFPELDEDFEDDEDYDDYNDREFDYDDGDH